MLHNFNFLFQNIEILNVSWTHGLLDMGYSFFSILFETCITPFFMFLILLWVFGNLFSFVIVNFKKENWFETLKAVNFWNSTLLFFIFFYYYLFFFNNDYRQCYQINLHGFWTQNVFCIDGLAMCFLLLTTFIFSLCFWQIRQMPNYNKFAAFLKFTQFGVMLTFLVTDLVSFYIFFESVLIPMYILIGVWGSRSRKIKAAYYLFLYTLFGSLFLLFGIIYLNVIYGTTYIPLLSEKAPFSITEQLFLWVCFFIPFAVKIPMYPFHIWLPEAHVEAPTIGSVILASLLLKLGGYGFLRITLPLFPYANVYFGPYIQWLAVIGVIHASIVSIRQMDLKRVIAYASIAHMNLVVLGTFAPANVSGYDGALYLMIAHGIVSAGLFFAIGFIYDRTHSRIIWYYGGIVKRMPRFVFFFLMLTLANMSFPGTSNFVGEFMIFVSLVLSNFQVLIFASAGIVLSAVYSVWLFNRVCFGTFKNKYFNISFCTDLTRTETICLFLLVLCMLFLGVKSYFVIQFTYPVILK